jgi:hypothetical protein
LQKAFKLTPAQHKISFDSAQRKARETFLQYSTRLRTLLKYYLESRNVDDFDKLLDLLLCDKIKSTVNNDLLMHVLNLEQNDWFHTDKLADICDNFVNNAKLFGSKIKPEGAT